jgi:hypothetical protein
MRRALLLSTSIVLLALGVADARAAAPSDQTIPAALHQPARPPSKSAMLIEGRSAVVYDSGDGTHVAESREAGQAVREDALVLMRNVALLGIASLVLGLGAIGATALWILDDTESSSHGWPRWFGR